MFFDRVTIKLKAGRGGNGVVSWRKAKYIPKGGPAGGNGSKGGDIILQADDQIPSLDWFRNRRLLAAEDGGSGASNQRQGRKGNDLILKVPCGTLVKDAATGDILYDLTQNGESCTICIGGKGGRGNESFKTPTNQAPNYCTPGKDGDEKTIELELKLIADIGFVGYPNAGKSTLINALANVPVKIAPYPFTTLQPNLGYIRYQNYRKILLADIPGIIEGASENKGLGFEFLRHIERNKGLAYILDASGIDGRDPLSDYDVLYRELQKYNTEVLQKPFVVILNKIDTPESAAHIEAFKAAHPELKENEHLFLVSSTEKIGLRELGHAFYKIVF